MRHITKIICMACVLAGMTLASCNDDFLQQDPTTELAEGSFLSNEGDLPIYLNQLYPKYFEGMQSDWGYTRQKPFNDLAGPMIAFGDLWSDNAVNRSNAFTRMDESWTVPTSGTNEGWEWGNLRTINYFLRSYRNAEKSGSSPEALNKYAAEAYFFKAWEYYKKVLTFGPVPWFSADLNVNSPELFAPRNTREEVMDSVLKCISFAVEHLDDNDNPVGRVNKDQANFLKARICLYEGTYRRYHTELGLQSTAEAWLTAAAEAANAIIESGHYALYGAGGSDSTAYYRLFAQKGMKVAHKEAIAVRTYDAVNIGSAFQRYYDWNGNRMRQGATKSLLDEYLCDNGQPIGQEGAWNARFKGYDGMWSEMENRDPRMCQTVCKPGEYQSVRVKGTTWEINRKKYGVMLPIITYNAESASVTGYLICKHWMNDQTVCDLTQMGDQQGIDFRYAEALLMYAEAKAELGSITQDDLDKTVNALRTRASTTFGAAAKLTLGSEPSDPRLDAVWQTYAGYTPSPIVREVRRERRVEMAMEGRRYEDLMRWKAGKLLTNPDAVRGMKFTAEKQAWYDGTHTSRPEKPAEGVDYRDSIYAPKSIKGTNVFTDANGFLVAYPKDIQVTTLDGSNNVTKANLPFTEATRYYWPIPMDQLNLNPNLKQSPGWEAPRPEQMTTLENFK